MPTARPDLEQSPEEPRTPASYTAPPSPPRAGPPASLPDRRVIERTVAQVFGIHARELRRATRGRAHVAQARQVAMYLAHAVLGLSLSQTGVLFHRDRTTVAHACALVEDMRDDPVFDRVLDLLEDVLLALINPRGSAFLMFN
jgi:hypothetical protein